MPSEPRPVIVLTLNTITMTGKDERDLARGLAPEFLFAQCEAAPGAAESRPVPLAV